jgi:hypothetical protein
MLMVAPGTRAPPGSLIVPRSEVVAVWAKTRIAEERMQKSIPPQKERFTSVPPKKQILRLRSPLWFEINLTPAAVAAAQ